MKIMKIVKQYERPKLESARDDFRNSSASLFVVLWVHQTGCNNGMTAKQRK